MVVNDGTHSRVQLMSGGLRFTRMHAELVQLADMVRMMG